MEAANGDDSLENMEEGRVSIPFCPDIVMVQRECSHLSLSADDPRSFVRFTHFRRLASCVAVTRNRSRESLTT